MTMAMIMTILTEEYKTLAIVKVARQCQCQLTQQLCIGLGKPQKANEVKGKEMKGKEKKGN